MMNVENITQFGITKKIAKPWISRAWLFLWGDLERMFHKWLSYDLKHKIVNGCNLYRTNN